MEYFIFGVVVLTAGVTVWKVWREGGDDPLWDLRWRARSPADRARIAVSGLPGASIASLTDPEERQLAEGFRRRELRRRAYLDLAMLAALAFAAALMLAGVTSYSTLGLILAVYAALRWPAESLRDRQIKRGVPAAVEPDAAPAP